MPRSKDAQLTEKATAISAAYLAKLAPAEREARIKAFEQRVERASRARSGSDSRTPAIPLHAGRR
jgi:hypothetical protein